MSRKYATSQMTLTKTTIQVLKIVFLDALAAAVIASLLIHLLGWLFGTVVFAGVACALFIRRYGLLYRWAEALLLL